MNVSDIDHRPILISIIPNLMGGDGHIIPYHTSVTQAANLLNWHHIALATPDSKIVDLPANWYPCLSSEDLEAKLHPLIRILKLRAIFNLGLSIAKKLNQDILPRYKYPIIFLERFIHVQLFALLIALYIIPTKNLSIWLLYRRDIHKDKTCWIYKLLNKAIKNKVASENFHLLTDSEILSSSISNYFHESIIVMPIPHTEFLHIENDYYPNDEIICWWAGPPRHEKGWNVIKDLVSSVAQQPSRICVVAAQASELVPINGGVRVQVVPNRLSKTEYITWLKKSHIILLPYDANAYKERTSGIFTESIMAGKIPLVTQGTWMAKELSKYDLTEVIIEDWSQPETIINKILDISQSLSIKNKVKEIQQTYQKFHTIEGFAEQMEKLFDTSYKCR